MSNQVYSNFETRKLYRNSETINFNSLLSIITIPSNTGPVEINSFKPLNNANYTYETSTKRLTFKNDGVYSLLLQTSWTLTAAGGRCTHYMLLNGLTQPKFGATSSAGYVTSTDDEALILSSNVLLKVKIGDQISFFVSGNNGGIQTLRDDSSTYRTEFFVSKLS